MLFLSLALLAFCGLSLLGLSLYLRNTSAFHRLPGPPVRTIFGTHLKHVSSAQSGHKVYDFLERKYGRTVRIRGAFPWEERLLIMDPVSMTHVLKNTDIYQKPVLSRRLIASLIGNGMLSSEGDLYQRQRRVLLPAFSSQNTRGLSSLVMKKGIQLRDKWLKIMDDSSSPMKSSPITLDLDKWISRVTFDVMGLAGFDYNFNAIEDESNELLRAYIEMFQKSATHKGLMCLIRLKFPILGWLLPDRVANRCRQTIHRMAGQLIQEKKHKLAHDEKNGHLQSGNDLLTLLLKSNSNPPEANMSVDELLDNVNTLIFAGTDTSALSVTWTLVLLTQNPTVQERLREELLGLIPPNTSLEELSDAECEALYQAVASLPLLNNVLRESLRLNPPLHSSLRVATKTDEVPTMSPLKLSNENTERNSYIVPKGTYVHICVEAFNTDKKVWGEDAWTYNPDRWDTLPEPVLRQPGVYSHLLTFSGGPRACPGWRFAVTEMKLLLFILISEFDFKSHPDYEIVKINKVLTRPQVSGKEGDGSQCPVIISKHRR